MELCKVNLKHTREDSFFIPNPQLHKYQQRKTLKNKSTMKGPFTCPHTDPFCTNPTQRETIGASSWKLRFRVCCYPDKLWNFFLENSNKAFSSQVKNFQFLAAF